MFDKDDGYRDYQTTIEVANVAPTATLSGPISVNEQSSAIYSLLSPSDASQADVLAGFRFSFALAP